MDDFTLLAIQRLESVFNSIEVSLKNKEKVNLLDTNDLNYEIIVDQHLFRKDFKFSINNRSLTLRIKQSYLDNKVLMDIQAIKKRVLNPIQSDQNEIIFFEVIDELRDHLKSFEEFFLYYVTHKGKMNQYALYEMFIRLFTLGFCFSTFWDYLGVNFKSLIA